MSTNFPTALDTATQLPDINPSDDMNTSGKSHDVMHSNVNDAVLALQQKVGINQSTDTTSLDYKIANSVSRIILRIPQTTNNTNWANYTSRFSIPGYMVVTGSKLRFTICSYQSSSTTLSVAAGYVAPAKMNGGSQLVEYATTPTPVTWGGNTSVTASGGSSLTSDWVVIATTQNTPLVIGLYFNSGDASGSGTSAYETGLLEYHATGNSVSSLTSPTYSSSGSWWLRTVEIA